MTIRSNHFLGFDLAPCSLPLLLPFSGFTSYSSFLPLATLAPLDFSTFFLSFCSSAESSSSSSSSFLPFLALLFCLGSSGWPFFQSVNCCLYLSISNLNLAFSASLVSSGMVSHSCLIRSFLSGLSLRAWRRSALNLKQWVRGFLGFSLRATGTVGRLDILANDYIEVTSSQTYLPSKTLIYYITVTSLTPSPSLPSSSITSILQSQRGDKYEQDSQQEEINQMNM